MLCIPYSCCFLVFLCVRFLSLLLAFQQAQVHRKRNSYASSIAFSSLEVLPVLRLGRFHTSPYLVFYLLLFLGCYSLYLIELVLSFSKSPSLLKSEFGRKRYHRFRKPCFLSAASSAAPGYAPDWPAKRPARRQFRRFVRRNGRRRRKSRRAVRGGAGLCAGLRRTSILNVIPAAAGLRRAVRRTVWRKLRSRRAVRRTVRRTNRRRRTYRRNGRRFPQNG